MSPEIVLVLFGDIPEADIRELEPLLLHAGFPVKGCVKVPVPQSAYNPRRGQYSAHDFLERVFEHGGLSLGITDVDLYTPDLNFVFGVAESQGRGAVISSHRLHSRNRTLFIERLAKEAVHELGHVMGLGHCPDEACVMHFSNCLADTDRKGLEPCGSCSTNSKRRGA